MKMKLFSFLVMVSVSAMAQAPRIVLNPMGHSAKIHNMIFTPDGKRIVSISEDKSVRVWNPETGEMLQKYESEIGDGPEGMLYASAISPDGKLLAVSGYPTGTVDKNYIVIIDLEKNAQVSHAVGHTNVVNTMSFSADGKFLASGSDDSSVKLWKVEAVPSLTNVSTIPVPSAVTCLSFNSKTNELAVVHDSKDILVYSLANVTASSPKFTPKLFKKHKGKINKIAYSPDGTYLASSSYDRELVLWEYDGTAVKEFEDIKEPINALSFSADAKLLVGLDFNGKGMSWAIPGGTKFTDYAGHDNTVFTACFSPSLSGNYVVASAGGINNEIHLWNPINGRTLKKIRGKGSAVRALAFGEGLEIFFNRDYSSKGPVQFSTSFNFATLSVNRNAKNASQLKKQNRGLEQYSENTIHLPKSKEINTDPNVDGRILDFQLLPTGDVIVASDFSLKMFDKNGLLSKEFVGHTGAVRAIALSNDGKYLASGGEDQTIILWRLNESGYAPSLRETFTEEGWAEFFSSMPNDSLTKVTSKSAWLSIIETLKKANDKTYREIETVFKGLGEMVNPFATLFMADDFEWVCWTPTGYFSCSSSGSQYFGWHVNKGTTQLADYYAAEQYFDILYRPEEMEKAISQEKRVEDVLLAEGERLFDLNKLHRPSVGLFNISATINNTDLLKYDQGKLLTQSRKVPISVEIYDGGGGVKEVNIYQNDKLIINEKSIKTSKMGEKVVKTYEIEMVNEVNEFKVKVVNFQKIESRADVLTIEYTGEVIANSTLHILTVGINKYLNSAYNLNYAQPDAKSFINKVQATSKSIFKSINPIEIYDEEATKENIGKAFRAIIAQAKPEDVFLFYYAGHGTLDEEHDDEYYLVPTDITKLYGDPAQLKNKGVSATDLKNYFMQLKSQKQIILMDACHSGGAVKTLGVRAAATDEKAIVQLARSSGVVMIAASGSKQFATEFAELQHGVFTYALLEALDGKADNGDKKITVNELKLYMEERVPELTKKYGGKAQYPTGYITGNDFPVSVIE